MFQPRDAQQSIAAVAGPLADEITSLNTAVGRVLATSVHADSDHPPFNRVAMDGIAIRFSDWQAGLRDFRVSRVQGAGAEPEPLTTSGDCIEIMTGAMLPDGADTVIPVEQISFEANVAHVMESATPKLGGNVHHQGHDRRRGSLLLTRGTRLRAPEIAILASAGVTRVPVIRQPRIAVVSTGDELVEPHLEPKPWQVRRSNAYGIIAALSARGYRDICDIHLPDDLPAMISQLAPLMDQIDVLILSGGVSAGRFDHVPNALAALGVTCHFHKVEQRPGRPLWFGADQNRRLVFGLPGNPVSTLICLTRYVLPALALLEDQSPEVATHLHLQGPDLALPTMTLFMPVTRVDSAEGLTLAARPTQGSGDFTALAETAGFVELAPVATRSQHRLVPFYHW